MFHPRISDMIVFCESRFARGMRHTIQTNLTLMQERKIRENIYSAAHSAILDWNTFRWHRTNDGPDAQFSNSSQAFCISVWGTFASQYGSVVRAVVTAMLNDFVLQAAVGAYGGQVPLQLESNSRELLNEHGGTQSHLDGVLRLKGLKVVVESKLFEQLGSCSQATKKYCSGIYGSGSDLKLHTTSACRLEYGERARTPRMYWDIMKSISHKDAYTEGAPCPFAGGGFQVMRNIAAAAKMAERGEEWRVIFAFPKLSDSKTSRSIELIQSKLAAEHRYRMLTLDYYKLAEELIGSDDDVARGLGEHMKIRLRPQS